MIFCNCLSSIHTFGFPKHKALGLSRLSLKSCISSRVMHTVFFGVSPIHISLSYGDKCSFTIQSCKWYGDEDARARTNTKTSKIPTFACNSILLL